MLYDLLPLLPQRVLITDFLLQIAALVIHLIRVNAALDQRVAGLLAQFCPFNTRSLKAGLRSVQAKINQVALFNGFLVGIKKRWLIVETVKFQKGVAVDKGGEVAVRPMMQASK